MPRAKRKKYIVILATSKQTLGGIAAVINCYEQVGLSRRWPVLHIATHCDGSLAKKAATAMAAFVRFLRLVVARRISLVHVHSASNASFWRKFTFMCVAFGARCPVIFHLHGGGFLDFYRGRRGALRRWLIRWVLAHAAEIVVLSDRWRREIMLLTRNSNITVVPNPILAPPVHAPQDVRRSTSTVLYMGRLVEEKGLFLLLDALVDVRRLLPNVKLQLAGTGELEAPLRRYAATKGMSENVEFLGWVSGEDKWRVLAQASLYVLPSDAEGLPMGVLEAMAVGLPVIATDVGGIPDVVEDGVNGRLIKPGDVHALRQALVQLLGDPALLDRMGRESHKRFAANFAAARVMPKIEAIYARAVGEPISVLAAGA